MSYPTVGTLMLSAEHGERSNAQLATRHKLHVTLECHSNAGLEPTSNKTQFNLRSVQVDFSCATLAFEVVGRENDTHFWDLR
eukprot:1370699-Amorphochlora_amoeboformis.AAC.1